jgi:crossover junction endodeoxyribonuclease RuvC
MGIDPGSRVTGFGIIEDRPSLRLIAYGAIKPPVNFSLPDRLKFIYQGLCKEIQGHGPEEVAIENIFFAKNPKSALILGQARGAAILSVANSNLNLSEYSATEIKQCIVGFGRAEKSQVSSMVSVLLKVKEVLKPLDASDALAVAICHAHTRNSLRRVFPR